MQRRKRAFAGSSRLDNFLKIGIFNGLFLIRNGRQKTVRVFEFFCGQLEAKRSGIAQSAHAGSNTYSKFEAGW